MQPYVIYSFLAAIVMAVTILVVKYTLKRSIPHLPSFLFLFHILHIVPGIAVYLWRPADIFSMGSLFALLAAVFWVGALYLINYALHHNDASVIGALFPLKLLFLPFISYLIIDEVFSASIYIWFVPLIIGGFLVALDEKLRIKSFFHRDIGIILYPIN